jgi:hypothetical protein
VLCRHEYDHSSKGFSERAVLPKRRVQGAERVE